MRRKASAYSVGDIIAFQIPEGFAYLCVAEKDHVYLLNFTSREIINRHELFIEENICRPIYLGCLDYFPRFHVIGRMSLSDAAKLPRMYKHFPPEATQAPFNRSEYESHYDRTPLSREDAMSMWKYEGACSFDQLRDVILKYRDQLTLIESDPASNPSSLPLEPAPDTSTPDDTEDTVQFEYQGFDEMVEEAVRKALARKLNKEKIEFEDDYNFVRVEAAHASRVLELLREILGKKVKKSERGDVEIVRHGPGDDDVREFSIVPMATYGVTSISSDITGALSGDLNLLMTDSGLEPERVAGGETDLRVDTPCIDSEGDRRALAAFREALRRHVTPEALADMKIYRLGPSDEISYYPAFAPEGES